MPSYLGDDDFIDSQDDSSYIFEEDDTSFFEENGWRKTPWRHTNFDVQVTRNPATWIGFLVVQVIKFFVLLFNLLVISPWNGIKWTAWKWFIHVDYTSDSTKKTVIQILADAAVAFSLGYLSGPMVTGDGSFGDIFYILNMFTFWLFVIDAAAVIVMSFMKRAELI